MTVLTVVLTATGVQAVTAPVISVSDRVEIKAHISIPEKIDYYANLYNVKPSLMRSIIGCESSFNPNAIGDNNTSFGLSQIHLPAHPDITKEQAFNEDFAIEFMAKALSQGKGSMWTCYSIVTTKITL